MTQEFYSILTQKGLNKQLECIENLVEFDISYIAVGDGNGVSYIPSKEQTSLKCEKWRGNVLTHGIEKNKLFVTTLIPINVGGFTIREIGLFDSNNILLCVGRCPETNKHTSFQGGAQELFIKFYMSITNRELVPLVVQTSEELASTEYVKNLLTNKQDKLITGEGIKIQDNVISATNTLRAGKGIAIVNNTIINTGVLFEELEQITIDIPFAGVIEGTIYEVIE